MPGDQEHGLRGRPLCDAGRLSEQRHSLLCDCAPAASLDYASTNHETRDQRFEVEAESYAALPKNVRHGFSVRGDVARLLVTVATGGVEYFFVPRDESDQDPSKYGPILEQRVPTAA